MVAAVQLWAEALAEKGTVGPEETDDLLELLFKDNSDAEHSQQQSCPAGSAKQEALLPLCSFIAAASRTHDYQTARDMTTDVRAALVDCIAALSNLEGSGVWMLSNEDLVAVICLLSELMQAKALAADSEAQAASHAIRELLCSALEEKQDVHSSADFANLRGRPAMLHALLQGCGSPTSPVSHLPLLGHDSLAVLQAAVESLARVSKPSASMGRRKNTNEELVMGLIGRLLATWDEEQLTGGHDKDWQDLLSNIMSSASERVQSALKSLAWTAVGDEGDVISEGQPIGANTASENSERTGAAAAIAAPVVAATGVHLCRVAPSEVTFGTVSAAIKDLTLLAESCVRAVWPLGVGSRTSSQLMALAGLTLMEASKMMSACVKAGGPVSCVPFHRLRVLVFSCGHLMQAAKVPESEWDWNLEAQDLVADYDGEVPTTTLARATVQATVQALGVCWTNGHETSVKSLLLPGAELPKALGPESVALPMLVGRLCVVLKGEEKLSRIVLPLLIDRLQAMPEPKSPFVLARTIDTLGKVAVAAAHNGDKWAYTQVADLLVKLYKEPSSSTSKHLMHSYDGGKSGAIAQVFTSMGSSLKGASRFFLDDLLDRLLMLFLDFALKMAAPKAGSSSARGSAAKPRLQCSVAADLAELLPSIAAISECLAEEGQESLDLLQISRTSFEQMQMQLKASASRMQSFRTLWMYCTVLGLTPVPMPYNWETAPQAAKGRIQAWEKALGVVAVCTSPILVEPGKQEQEMLVDNRARLQRLGEAGSRGALSQGIGAVGRIPGGEGAPAISAAMAAPPERHAYLLAVAGLELVRASTSELAQHRKASHMAAILEYLHRQAAPDFTYLKSLTGGVFESYLKRVKQGSGQVSAGEDVRAARESLAGVLVDNLSVPGGNAGVSHLSESLLMRLLEACPSLLWSRRAVGKLLAVAGKNDSVEVKRVANKWMSSAAKSAPMCAEAVLHEELRTACSPGWQGQVGLEAQLLASFSTSTSRGQLTGLQALSRKLYYSGVVSGLEASRSVGDNMTSWSLAADMLRTAVQEGTADVTRLQECYLQAVAVLVEHGRTLANADYFQLLRLLAWVPDKFMDPEITGVVSFGLTWVAIGTPTVTATMLSEVANVWVSSANKKVGLFAGGSISERDLPPQELLRAIEAQHSLLSLLEEQWALTAAGAMHLADAAMMIFRRMLENSLHRASNLLLHPTCTFGFFRLMTLALNYCLMKSRMPAPKAGDNQTPLLFSRVVRAVLLWFSAPPLYYQWPSDPLMNNRNVEAIERFILVLGAFNPLPSANIGGNPEGYKEHPVWGKFESSAQATEALRDKVALLHTLLRHEADRLKVWASPLVAPQSTSSAASGSASPAIPATQWGKHVASAWQVHPKLAVALLERYPANEAVQQHAVALVAKHAHESKVKSIPAAARLLAQAARNNPKQKHILQHLADWEVAGLVSALKLMYEDAHIQEIRNYALRSLHSCDPKEVAFYLPQLVQALRNDQSGDLKEYLKSAASQSYIFCHRLIWNLQSEEKPPPEAMNPEVKRSGWEPPKDTGLWEVTTTVKKEVVETLTPEDRDYLDREFAFFDDVTKISGYLKKYDKAERPFKIGGYLKEVVMRGEDLYLPTNTDSRVLRLIPESGTPMQSAAKVPILVAFEVESMGQDKKEAVKRHNQACIFKVGDDCRQDVMALQVIDLLKQVFTTVGLDLYLVPYGVLPTGYERGIIEVVPNSASRAGLGETSESGLHDIFEREFGAPGTRRFEEARLNFIKSSAGYAVASFLLQAKDRHNGNILLDVMGNLVHIDFGFVLEISPGNNMRFESAAFKLSHEMCQLLDPGAQRTSPSFKLFEELCIKGFLAARINVDAIMAAVGLMVDSGLPCFGRGEPMKNLYNRFHMEKTDKQAAEFMRATIADAYDKWTTRFYDVIQWYQQGIEK